MPHSAEHGRIRVGILSTHDPNDPNALSGTPFSACAALREQGFELVDLARRSGASAQKSAQASASPSGFSDRAQRLLRDAKRAVGRALSRPWEMQRALRNAARLSGQAQRSLDAAEVDILFGVCMSSVFYTLETDLPIVYASDSTAKLINTTYPVFRRRPSGYHRACDEIERTALSKCRVFAASSRRTAESAVRDYGLDPSRVRVVEFGAHIVPGDEEEIAPEPPQRDCLEMVLVAADPRRKRLGFCIEVAEILRKRGWGVTLNYIGPRRHDADRNPLVVWRGALRLSDPSDRETHKRVLRRSHWLLLPSTAEAFGIAPCEAAHFGRPSAVAGVGGLPTVVVHEETGVVLPANASPAAYADAIERISADPDRYMEMSRAALLRARAVLSWPVWGRRMKEIFMEVLNGGAR